MTVVSPAALWGEVQLGASVAILGQLCPANSNQIVKRAVFTNTHTQNVTITVYVTRNGAAPGPTNIIISAYSLSPGQAYTSPELANLVLGSNDGVYAFASVSSKVNTIGSGFQQ